jgi:hypothetical protein
MAENICLILTELTLNSRNGLPRVLSLAAAAVDLHKRTVLYVGGSWLDLALAGGLERRVQVNKAVWKGYFVVELFRHFQSAGGQLWVSSFEAQQHNLGKEALEQGVTFVDDKTLLTFLTQDTVVLNF